MLSLSFAALSCDRPAHAESEFPRPATDLPASKEGEKRTAIFAGGCFWCTEGVFQKVVGVTGVVSGYAGGSADTATYAQVSEGTTGHAEAIQITYDPSKTSFGQLLRAFFATHDPTTKDRQGADHGTQYRSAVFYQNEDEKKVAEAYIKQLDDAKIFSRPIVTTLEPLAKFYPAEDYHQDYVNRNPNQPYIEGVAIPKIEKLKKYLPDQVKPEADKK